MLDICIKNNDLLLKDHILKKIKRKEYIPKTLSQLKDDLNMTVIPKRIEAFDNSNIQGKYPVSGMVNKFTPQGYLTDGPIIPHGMSVALNAPAVFKFTASSNPDRHLNAARLLGEKVTKLDKDYSGEILANTVINIMRKIGMPNGLRAVGYSEKDVDKLVELGWKQKIDFKEGICKTINWYKNVSDNWKQRIY